MTPVLHPGVGSLMDRLVGVGNLGESRTSWRSCVSNFIKTGLQEPCQNDPRPILDLDPYRLVGVVHLDESERTW